MVKEVNLSLSPSESADAETRRHKAAEAIGIRPGEVNDIIVLRRSIDARGKRVRVNMLMRVAWGDDSSAGCVAAEAPEYKRVTADSPVVVIVGAGPAGLFAALRALEVGIKPIVLERGRDVDTRRRDLAMISRTHNVDSDSNYCFGEGGAGAFSDGKLYTRSKKRGNVREILEGLYHHGASEDILIDAHPHIGTDKLPGIIRNIRATILDHGGEVRFGARVERLIIEDSEARGVVLADGSEVRGPVVLATGHSARDVYRMLDAEGVEIEAKGLAIGVRLEHPQHLIDCIQYHSKEGRGKYLPAAEYSFVTQADGRGVYSFCMCPGGVVVPAASGSGQLVVNGMSASGRSSRWANSGMVVEVHPEDFPEYSCFGPLALMHLQEELEKRFYEAAGETLKAPAQRMTDFVQRRDSKNLPASSYPPGIQPGPIHELLPPFISERLRTGLLHFGRVSQGFLSPDATLIGLESRTSSPVRIPRGADMNHVRVRNLFPAGEGAGYAGGIVSAAIDGRRCIDSLFQSLDNK